MLFENQQTEEQVRSSIRQCKLLQVLCYHIIRHQIHMRVEITGRVIHQRVLFEWSVLLGYHHGLIFCMKNHANQLNSFDILRLRLLMQLVIHKTTIICHAIGQNIGHCENGEQSFGMRVFRAHNNGLFSILSVRLLLAIQFFCDEHHETKKVYSRHKNCK